MFVWTALVAVGLSLLVTGGAVAPPEGQVLPGQGAGGEEVAVVERTCLTPRWGESKPCAAFALAVGASVEIVLKEVKDDGTDDPGTKIVFRLYDIKGQIDADTSDPVKVGDKYTYTNKTSAALDLVVYAKNTSRASNRDIRFTYEKK